MKKILVIDDEEWLREMVQMALTQRGYEVIEAPNGVVGVDLAAIDPALEFANAVALVGDLAQPTVREAVLVAAGGRADVLLSDAALIIRGQAVNVDGGDTPY